MTTRAQAAENALASVRTEGLDPGVAEALLRRWARGKLSDTQTTRRVRLAPASYSRRHAHSPELVQRSRSGLSIRGAGNDRSHACSPLQACRSRRGRACFWRFAGLTVGRGAALLSATRGAHDAGESRLAIQGAGSAARSDQHALATAKEQSSAGDGPALPLVPSRSATATSPCLLLCDAKR